MDETPESDDLLGFLTEDGRHRRDPDDHPSVEKLTAYQANELTPEEDSRIQDHLLICKHCTDLLLDLEGFLQPAQEQSPPAANFEQAADWKILQEKLKKQRTISRRWTRGPSRRIVTAMAAVLLVAIGFSFYIRSRSPEKVQTLVSINSSRGPEEVEVVQPPVDLLLKFSSTVRYSEYRADLKSESRKHVKNFTGLKESSSFGVRIPLKEGALLPGNYQIDLYGIQNGASLPVGTYAFKITRH